MNAKSGREAKPKTRAGPAGLHVFDRATGLNLLFDEIRIPKSAWSLAPRQVSLSLTNACDLACPYCYADKSPLVLDTEKAAIWLKELDLAGCLGVGFGGGEPTLDKGLPDLCRIATAETQLAVTITTHAHRFSDELATSLTGHVNFIRVSMDGVGSTYEDLRDRSFDHLIDRIEVIGSLAPFGINYVVNSQTVDHLDAAAGLACDLGATELLLLPEQPTRDRTGIDEKTAAILRNWIATNKTDIALTISENGSEGLPVCSPLGDEKGLRGYAHISAGGELRRSSFATSGVPIGNEGVIPALQHLRVIGNEV